MIEQTSCSLGQFIQLKEVYFVILLYHVQYITIDCGFGREIEE